MASEEHPPARSEQFWRDFPAMAGYFSPGIVPLMNYLGLDSKQVMYQLGEQIGISAASKLSGLSAAQMLEEFSKVWDDNRIGRLTVESRTPLTIQISNCAVCGQLQGTAETFECAFHEGFFHGALTAKVGHPVNLRQELSREGDAGTWCRKLASDTSI